MIKKRKKTYFIVLVSFLLLLILVNAFSFTDFFKITGHQIENNTTSITNCDQGTIPSSPGCYCGRGDSTGLTPEYSGYCCWGSFSYTACTTTIEPCTDSDSGINVYIKGTASGNYRGATTRAFMTYEDECSTIDSSHKQLNEGYCDSEGYLSTFGAQCQYGCQGGVCLSAPNFSCSVDSDCLTANVSGIGDWAGATFCDGTGLKLMQYKESPTCQSGVCVFSTSKLAVKEDCSTTGKVCDFTTAGGGVYACITGTAPGTCPISTKITNRCVCGSGYADSYNIQRSSYYCCSSGSNLYLSGGGDGCPSTSYSTGGSSGGGSSGGGGAIGGIGSGGSGGAGNETRGSNVTGRTGGENGETKNEGVIVVFRSSGVSQSQTANEQSGGTAGQKEVIFIINKDESKIITPQGIEVKSEVPLNVDEEGKAYATTREGVKKEIVVSPSDAQEIVKESTHAEIKDTTVKEYKSEVVYEVKAVKDVKILSAIKSKMSIQANVDVKDGTIIDVKKPWWSVVATS